SSRHRNTGNSSLPCDRARRPRPCSPPQASSHVSSPSCRSPAPCLITIQLSAASSPAAWTSAHRPAHMGNTSIPSTTRCRRAADLAAAGTNLGIPRVEVEGLPFDRIRFGAPQGEGTPAIFAQNIYEFSDTLSKLFGNHATKYGIVIRKEQENSDLSAGGARPDYSFRGLWNLAYGTTIFEG